MDNLPFELLCLLHMFISLDYAIYSKTFFLTRNTKFQLIIDSDKKTISTNGYYLKSKEKSKYFKLTSDKLIQRIVPKNTRFFTFYQHKYYFEDYLSDIPTKLIGLKLIGRFDESVKHMNFSETIKCLKFGDCFNRKIHSFPSGLKKLQLGNSYDRILDNLPEDLEFLAIGEWTYYDDLDSYEGEEGSENNIRVSKHWTEFNNCIFALSKLKTLYFNNRYPIFIKRLPKSIKYLSLNKISTDNDVILPPNLKIWIAPKDCYKLYGNNRSINSLFKIINNVKIIFQSKLTYLVLNRINVDNIKDYLNLNVDSVFMVYENGSNLDLSSCTCRCLKIIFLEDIEKYTMIIPSNLKKLIVLNYEEGDFHSIPNTITHINIASPLIKNRFPPDIKKVKLVYFWVIIKFPDSLEELHFTGNNNKNEIPIETIEALRNSNIKHIEAYCKLPCLPPKIIKAKLFNKDQKFDFEIPKSLIKLYIRRTNVSNIPPCIKYVFLKNIKG